MNDDLIRIGHVLAPHGVGGQVRLFVIGRAEQLLNLKRVLVEDAGWLRVQKVERHGPAVVLTFAGLQGREAAERLVGKAVLAAEQELPPLPEDEYYYHELRGLPVVTPEGARIGEVEDVQDAGAQDLLVVRHGGRLSLVPLQAPYVVVRRGEMIVLDAPPGLLDGE